MKRKGIEDEFFAALKTPAHKTLLIYGQRGSGKTSFILNALNARSGVLLVNISAETGSEATKELIDELLTQVDVLGVLGGPPNKTFVADIFAASSVSPIIVVSIESQ